MTQRRFYLSHYPLTTFILFTSTFWVLELLAAALLWGIWIASTIAPESDTGPTTRDDYDRGDGRVKQEEESDTETASAEELLPLPRVPSTSQGFAPRASTSALQRSNDTREEYARADRRAEREMRERESERRVRMGERMDGGESVTEEEDEDTLDEEEVEVEQGGSARVKAEEEDDGMGDDGAVRSHSLFPLPRSVVLVYSAATHTRIRNVERTDSSPLDSQ